jgi:DNA-directed RNA polymerase subunit M/transcription elongation factor TFIIS
MAERLKIICPKCDNVIAVAPEAGLAEMDLVCSNCGAELRAPGPLEKTADKVKALLKDAEKKIEKKVRCD